MYDLLKNFIIRESQSLLQVQILLVQKKDGNFRIVLDSRIEGVDNIRSLHTAIY